MGLIGRTHITTQKYGSEKIEDLYKYRLFNANILVYNDINKQVEFSEIQDIIVETRRGIFEIKTAKGNLLHISEDLSMFNGVEWKKPKDFVVKENIWIIHTKFIVSDALTAITYLPQNHKIFCIKTIDNLPYAAGKILVKEAEEI